MRALRPNVNRLCRLPALLAAVALAAWTPSQEDADEIPRPKTTEAPATAVFSIRARVVDAGGQPLAAVALAIDGRDALTSATTLAAPLASSDAQGHITLEWDPTDAAAAAMQAPTIHLAAKGRVGHARAMAAPTDGVLDLGTVVLPAGATLFGRVRQADGQPLAGVRVVAVDTFRGNRLFREPNTPWQPWDAALSDAGGIFKLPATFAEGADLTFSLAGFFTEQRRAVSRTSPLEITLSPAPKVLGRLLDPRGSGVQGSVSVAYEREARSTSVQTQADGTFELVVAHPGRVALTGHGGQFGAAVTDLLTPPVEALELVLEDADAQPTEDNGPQGVVHIVVRDAAGQPVAGARAAVLWDATANYAPYYREYRIHNAVRSGTATGDDGAAELSGPRPNQPLTGVAVVLAEGHGMTRLTDIEWDQAEETEGVDGAAPTLRLNLTIDLQPEAAASGVVVDEATGQPLPGAHVWLSPDMANADAYFKRRGQTAFEATGADDGTFRIGSLDSGDYKLWVEVDGRPTPRPQLLSLESGQILDDLRIAVPRGATLRGTLTGCRPGPGWQARLQILPQLVAGSWNYQGIIYANNAQPEDAVEVGTDGSFELRGIARGNYMLEVLMPGAARGGGPLRFPVEPFKVRSDLARNFDVSADLPGRVRGRVTFSGAAVPLHHLVATLRLMGPGQEPINFGAQDLGGVRAMVGRDGSFEIPAVTGRHTLKLIDITTGIALRSAIVVEVDAGAEVDLEIPVDATEVVLTLGPDPDGSDPAPRADVSRVELRVSSLEDQDMRGRRNAVIFGGNTKYDTGVGIDVPAGATSIVFYAPPGEILALARSNVAMLLRRPGEAHQQPEALGQVELTVEPGAARVEKILDPGPVRDRDPPRGAGG